MSRFIVKLGEGKYIEWGTVVDAPVTNVLTRNEIRDHLKNEASEVSIPHCEERIKRADANGTSLLEATTASEAVAFNRAGDNETCLTLDEIIEKYKKDEQ